MTKERELELLARIEELLNRIEELEEKKDGPKTSCKQLAMIEKIKKNKKE